MKLNPEQQRVKDETKRVQDAMTELDVWSAEELRQQFKQAMDDMAKLVLLAGGGGAVSVASMAALLQALQQRLIRLGAVRDNILDTGIQQAADLGVAPLQGRIPGYSVAAARQSAINHVRDFVDPSKLNLSDRIWRLDRHAEEIVRQAVSNSAMRGDGAAQAARDFLIRGVPVPADIQLARAAAAPGQINTVMADELLTGRGSTLDNTLRVMRTEINRAHTNAYQTAAAGDPDSVGTRFMLSPRHPRVDICDMHARANLFGLGAGVYPHGRSPLPAHPNTLSFEVIVYRDEVSDDDRKGKQTVTGF